jgi:hypothetical protein
MSSAATAPRPTTSEQLDDALSAIRAMGHRKVRLVGFIAGYDTFRIYGTLRTDSEFSENERSHTFEFYDDNGGVVGAFVFYDHAVSRCEIDGSGNVEVEEEGLITWYIGRF